MRPIFILTVLVAELEGGCTGVRRVAVRMLRLGDLPNRFCRVLDKL